ncbi:hypothetical protein ACFE04_009359 [Oxalis oulophora]
MKLLLQSISALKGRQSSLLVRHRSFSTAAASNQAPAVEEYAKRNYANNVSEYNTVISSLTAQRRHFLLRDVYDDMVLDGVQPSRDVFHSLIVGTMKGSRLQDAFYYRDQMKAMGLVPDVPLYNFLISTCGKCKNSDQAIKIFEEMKRYELKPNGQTYICLLNACAATGNLDKVRAIVSDMTAAGAGLNKFCYAGLITAHVNKIPMTNDIADKIIELVISSKGWSSVESSHNGAENMMRMVSEEELYNLPTAEFAFRRGFVNRKLTVFHVAFHACADLKNVQATEALFNMLKENNEVPDLFIIIQRMRCYLNSGDLDRGVQIFEEHMESKRLPAIELYTTLVEGAMIGYTPRGMQLAQETLVNMNARNFFLSPKQGSDLLRIAAREKTGGYTTANFIWDLMQARRIIPTLPATEAYYNGLKEREIPADDPRLVLVGRTCDNLRQRLGPGGGRS